AEWFIRQCGEYRRRHGRPLIDVFDLHWYPQATMQGRDVYRGVGRHRPFNELRLRSTRDLWDPTYEQESWIREASPHQPTMVLRRVRQWIDKHNPGMTICLGEYNFGGGDNISGALAQADVFGILAREQVELAFLWTHPEGSQELAWQLFRNYDRRGGRFGNRYLPAESNHPDLAVYAARRLHDQATTVVLINKNLGGECSVTMECPGLKGNLRVWRFDQQTLAGVMPVDPAVNHVDGRMTIILPAASATLIEIK
ncbi:MAG: glycoside hydrolase family 44 protein, partial [Nitrospira sp.]|nr:glycoside hydrolase family 44 protein [Nitrospira sp.]